MYDGVVRIAFCNTYHSAIHSEYMTSPESKCILATKFNVLFRFNKRMEIESRDTQTQMIRQVPIRVWSIVEHLYREATDMVWCLARLCIFLNFLHYSNVNTSPNNSLQFRSDWHNFVVRLHWMQLQARVTWIIQGNNYILTWMYLGTFCNKMSVWLINPIWLTDVQLICI